MHRRAFSWDTVLDQLSDVYLGGASCYLEGNALGALVALSSLVTDSNAEKINCLLFKCSFVS